MISVNQDYVLVQSDTYFEVKYILDPVEINVEYDNEQKLKKYDNKFINLYEPQRIFEYLNIFDLIWYELKDYYDEYQDISNIFFKDIVIPFHYYIDMNTIYFNNFDITITPQEIPLLKVQDVNYIYTLLSPNKQFKDSWFEQKYQRFKDIKIKSIVNRVDDSLQIKVIDDNQYRFLLRKLNQINELELLYQFDQRERFDIQNIVIEEQLSRIDTNLIMELFIPRDRFIQEYNIKTEFMKNIYGENRIIFNIFHLFDEYGNPTMIIIYPFKINLFEMDYLDFEISNNDVFDLYQLFKTYGYNLNQNELKQNYPQIIVVNLNDIQNNLFTFEYEKNKFVIENQQNVYMKDRNGNILNHGDDQYKGMFIHSYSIIKGKITTNMFNTSFFRDVNVYNSYSNFKNSEILRISDF